MADELNPVAEIEPETAIEEQPETVTNEPETGEVEGAAEGTEPEAQQEEFDSIELDGKQYQVPKALKPGFMMQADYTRKTQEVANQRRELEQGQQRLQQQFQANEEEMGVRATLVAIDAQLQQYGQVNWDQLEAEDPMAAGREWRRFQSLEKAKGQLQADLQQKANLRSQEAEQEIATRFARTQEHAQKNIKGWTPELDKQIIDWAKAKGATDENLLSAMSPLLYEVIYLARLGEQTLSKTTALKPQAQANTKPTSTVGGKSNPSAGKTLADMNMDEYVAHRKRQEAQRGR